jgi:hypothetical protein
LGLSGYTDPQLAQSQQAEARTLTLAGNDDG